MTTPTQPMSQLWPLTVATPAGVLETAPQVTNWPMVDANLDYIEIIVPDGPSGQVGLAIFWAGTQIVPWGSGTWLITNSEKIHIPVDTYITVTGLQVMTYNLGIYEHTIYLRALIKYTAVPIVTEAPEIGTTQVLPGDEASYDESLTPETLTGNVLESPELAAEGELPFDESSSTELPETVT
jgi:hypothetical protein